MNRKISFFIVGFVLLILGSGVYLLTTSSGKQEKDEMIAANTTPAASSPAPDITETQPAPVTQPGKYIDYSDAIVAATPGTKLLFFHAPWCPQCRAIDEDIKSDGVPSGITIIKVDYDSNQTLRKKYGVTIQTTIVKIDDEGNLVKKYVAYDEPTLASVISNIL